jgi:hypothetical protein
VSDGTWRCGPMLAAVCLLRRSMMPVAPSSPISLASGTEDTAYTIQAVTCYKALVMWMVIR